MKLSSLHYYLYLVLLSGIGNSIPIVTNTEALKYMTTFGWLDPISDSIGSQPMIDVRKSVREFQAFAGLNITGELDEDTLELMSLPRCGVRDKNRNNTISNRRKRYALEGYKWISRNLTYGISKYPRLLQTLGRDHIDAEINSAFEVWQKESNITFTRKTVGKVDIEIRFESRAHGDGDAFDGEGGTLAHAYFPRFGGDAHFDDDEKWTIKSHRGTNLFQVAAHEFGHSLGLLHSEVRDSLMAPFYRGYKPGFKLHSDDIVAIQKLYGKRALPLPKPKTTSAPTTTRRSTLSTTRLPTIVPTTGTKQQVKDLLLKLLARINQKNVSTTPQPKTTHRTTTKPPTTSPATMPSTTPFSIYDYFNSFFKDFTGDI